MYVMEFAIPRCGWNRTQILKKWPHSEIKLSFSSPLLFPTPKKSALWREILQLYYLLSMNTMLMWQFECCQEQKSLAFKIGHENYAVNAHTW